MNDARDVARHLVRVGYSSDSPEESSLLCPLRLQKFLYYCQGWGLALLGEPLFSQPIEAWTKGPVVYDVYKMFPKGKSDGIRPDEAGEPTAIAETSLSLIGMVWSKYAGYTPGQLASMTHSEPAWADAIREGLGKDKYHPRPLSPDTMRAYFTGLAEKEAKKAVATGYPVPNPADVWQADLQLERAGGRGIPIRESVRRAKAARVS